MVEGTAVPTSQLRTELRGQVTCLWSGSKVDRIHDSWLLLK